LPISTTCTTALSSACAATTDLAAPKEPLDLPVDILKPENPSLESPNLPTSPASSATEVVAPQIAHISDLPTSISNRPIVIEYVPSYAPIVGLAQNEKDHIPDLVSVKFNALINEDNWGANN
jgi:hypothetical protein